MHFIKSKHDCKNRAMNYIKTDTAIVVKSGKLCGLTSRHERHRRLVWLLILS